MTNILKEMLLIQDPSILRLYREMMDIAGYFVAPFFLIALILESFGEMNFGRVVIKLLLIIVFMGAFYEFHTKAVELSLESASITLKKVSPRNLFVKKWNYSKVKTKEKKEWNFIQSFAIPNLNDLLATGFFLLSKVFIWLLKLIYSSVYHLSYVFSGVTAILYFLGWTKDALKGTVQSSLWCMVMPFVIVAILALVGNSIDEAALSGDLLIAKIDTIIWLFGITLLLLISPLIAYGMVKGDGIHSFGAKMGSMVVSSGMKSLALLPYLSRMGEKISSKSVFSDGRSQKQTQNFDRMNQSKFDFRQDSSKKKGSEKEKMALNRESNSLWQENNSARQTPKGSTVISKTPANAPLAQIKEKNQIDSKIAGIKATPRPKTLASPLQNRNVPVMGHRPSAIKNESFKTEQEIKKETKVAVPTKREATKRSDPLRARRKENGLR